MYMQVDVPMERVPVANWLLIAGTCVISIGLWAAQSKYEHRVLSLPDDLPFDAAAAKQLDDPRLSKAKRDAVEAKVREQIRAAIEAKAAEMGNSPMMKWALHTDWDDFRFYQLVTHAFAHGDILHLIGNMLFLFCFGNAVCAKVGNLLYLPLYLVLAVLTGLASVALRVGVNIGASGAIMGVTGLFLVLYPVNEIAVWTLRSMMWTGDAWRFPSWMFIVFYMVLDFVGLLLDHEFGGGINYIAHLAGWACGFGIGVALVMTRFVESDRSEQFLPEIWGWLGEKPRKRRRKKKRPDQSSTASERKYDL